MKKKKTIIAAVILLLLFIVGGAIAYFTDKETATNQFTIGNVDIEVIEPAWEALTDTDGDDIPDVAEDMMPGETVDKDPTIHNLSDTNRAFVFMKVVAPCSTGATINEQATPVREVFNYTINSGWYLMTPDNSCQNGTVTRIYAYGTANAMTALPANDGDATSHTDETPALFSEVTLNPNLDGTEVYTSNIQNIDITGYGIQVEGLLDEDVTATPAIVWPMLNS